MENAVASQPGGHHTSATALAAAANTKPADEHAGMAGMNHDTGKAPTAHAHAPDPDSIKFKMRDPKDPLYPCTAIAEKYVPSCYQNQGGILLGAVGSDFARAAAA
jgi:hypothetical protein